MIYFKNSSQRGSTLVEGAFALQFFLIFLLFSFDLSRFVYQKAAIQYALTAALRGSVLGVAIPPYNEYDSVIFRTQQEAALYGIDLTAGEIESCDALDGDLDGSPDFDPNSVNCLRTAVVAGQRPLVIMVNKPVRLLVFPATIRLRAHVFGLKEPA